MSEHQTKDPIQDVSTNEIKVGSILQVTHVFLKTRDDELDLILGDIITVVACPDGGWCRGVKGIETKNPTTGWFPVFVSKVHTQSYQIENFNSEHQRSKSANIFSKSLKTDETSRTRSTSAPLHGTFLKFKSLSNDLEAVADASLVSLNNVISTTLRIPESDRNNESNRFSAQPRSLKSSFFASRSKEYMALRELADTEWHYLHDLYLIKNCRKVVSKLLALSDGAIKTLFGNLDQLIQVHQLLNDDLEILMVQGTQSASQLANIFDTRMEDFLAYIEYGNNYQLGQDKLKKLSKKRMRMQPQNRNLGLESFLIAPIQRLCKYPLLLKQIVTEFEADGRDTSSLRDTLLSIEKYIFLVNDAIKQSPTAKKTAKYNKKSFEKSGSTILKEEKIIIHLHKKNQKKGYLFLFNDCVVIAKKSWGGTWTTILDVSLADSSFSMNLSEKATELVLKVKESLVIISFKTVPALDSFTKTYSSLLDSCKVSKSSLVFDAVVALDGVADGSGDESDFSDDGGFLSSFLSFESPNSVTQESVTDVFSTIPFLEPTSKVEELTNASLRLGTLKKSNQTEENNEKLKNNSTDLEKEYEALKNHTVKLIYIEGNQLLQLQTDYAIPLDEKQNLKNQLLFDNEILKTKLYHSERSVTSGLNKLNHLEDNISQLIFEKSLYEVHLDIMQNEIIRLNSFIKINDIPITKTAEELKILLKALTVEHQQLISDFKSLQLSQMTMIDRISSSLSLKHASDLHESIRLGEEKSKRVLTLKVLYHKAQQEIEKLSSDLNVYEKDKGEQSWSIKQEYDSLEKKFNLLLNDLIYNQGRLYTMEKELGKKNFKLNDLEARLQASFNEIYQLKGYISEIERTFNEQRLSLTDHIKKLEAKFDDIRRAKTSQEVHQDFYLTMISKLEKEMMENKTQLIESKESLKAELKKSQAQYDKRGYCLRKLYTQLQDALVEKEKLSSRYTNSQKEIQDLQVDQSKLVVEREALKKQIQVLHDSLSTNEKTLMTQHERGRKRERSRSDYESKEHGVTALNSDKEVTVWKTIFFEMEVILGISERCNANLPSLDYEVRVARTVSKIRSMVKEIKESRKQYDESQNEIKSMGVSLQQYYSKMNELISSITIMAQEIKSKTSDFENQINEKNILIDALVKKNASEDTLESLREVKQERNNYKIRLCDSNELIRQLSAEISVLKAELEKSEKTISDQEVMISDFCIKTQRLQGQIMRLQERLEEAQAVEADHIFELDKLEKRLEKKFKFNSNISLNSAETLT